VLNLTKIQKADSKREISKEKRKIHAKVLAMEGCKRGVPSPSKMVSSKGNPPRKKSRKGFRDQAPRGTFPILIRPSMMVSMSRENDSSEGFGETTRSSGQKLKKRVSPIDKATKKGSKEIFRGKKRIKAGKKMHSQGHQPVKTCG